MPQTEMWRPKTPPAWLTADAPTWPTSTTSALYPAGLTSPSATAWHVHSAPNPNLSELQEAELPIYFGPPLPAPHPRRWWRRRWQGWYRDWSHLAGSLLIGFAAMVVVAGCQLSRTWVQPSGALAVAKPSAANAAQVVPSQVQQWVHQARQARNPNDRLVAYRQLHFDSAASQASQQYCLDALVTGLQQEPSVYTRSQLLFLIATYPVEQREPILLSALQDKEAVVRADACRLLAQCGTPSARQTLLDLLRQSPEATLRIVALRSLLDAKEPNLRAVLLHCLTDENVAVSQMALQELQQQTGQDFGPNLQAWADHLQLPIPGEVPNLFPPTAAEPPLMR